jgi:hypothetical protein
MALERDASNWGWSMSNKAWVTQGSLQKKNIGMNMDFR